jgi:tetratricopeptide (TPR) repeat protein
MRVCRSMVFSLVFLCVALWGGRAVAAADPPELYRASYQAEARGDYVGALANMRQIRKAASSSYFLALRTGWLAYLAGEFSGAEVAYREAVAAKPKAVEAKLGLTLVLFVAKKWNELETTCTQVLSQDSKHPAARARLAAAQYNLGKFSDSAQGYRKLVDDYPGELDYQTGLAWALLRMRKNTEARSLFEAVLAVSPDNPSARAGLATK